MYKMNYDAMKNRRFTILILLLTFNSYCQIGHLTPYNNLEHNTGLLKEYYNNVFPLLYKNFNKKPVARYTSMPSFETEYAFSVEKKNDEFVIISNILTQNYWYAKNRKSVRLITNKTAIEEKLYLKIAELFHLLQVQTKVIDEELYMFDGTTYYFSSTSDSGEVKTGETWSPGIETYLGKLTEVCNHLFNIGNGKEKQGIIIEKEVDKLIEQLKQ